ncbi:Det1 complexing ubiquitin ligase [Zea mays]|uniref:Det1 complexing ubiquitin ligase n=1 Tax=Zea mays TaxID=4577 RepID=A0A1D6JM66_MAIZE|nr:Det1 complexing ubiquitin ligase [Zea mays]
MSHQPLMLRPTGQIRHPIKGVLFVSNWTIQNI